MIFDTGGLLAVERADPRMTALLMLLGDEPIHIPTVVVGQAWRDGRRQARLARLLKQRNVSCPDITLDDAKAAGVLLGLSGTDDVVDAAVIVAWRRHGGRIITSDADDMRVLDTIADVHPI